MKIAKEDEQGVVSRDDQRKLDEMMSHEEDGRSYSVEVDVSQLLFHDIDSSIHYVSQGGRQEAQQMNLNLQLNHAIINDRTNPIFRSNSANQDSIDNIFMLREGNMIEQNNSVQSVNLENQSRHALTSKRSSVLRRRDIQSLQGGAVRDSNSQHHKNKYSRDKDQINEEEDDKIVNRGTRNKLQTKVADISNFSANGLLDESSLSVDQEKTPNFNRNQQSLDKSGQRKNNDPKKILEGQSQISNFEKSPKKNARNKESNNVIPTSRPQQRKFDNNSSKETIDGLGRNKKISSSSKNLKNLIDIDVGADRGQKIYKTVDPQLDGIFLRKKNQSKKAKDNIGIIDTFKTVYFFDDKSDDGVQGNNVDEDEITVKIDKYKKGIDMNLNNYDLEEEEQDDDQDDFDELNYHDFVTVGEVGEKPTYIKGLSEMSENFLEEQDNGEEEKEKEF